MTQTGMTQTGMTQIGTTPGYMPGFGNDFETEALPGALPQGMNSPQKCAFGLYGEQLSGTAFTAPSHQNERTWCYRIRPSVKHSSRYSKIDLPYWKSAPNVRTTSACEKSWTGTASIPNTSRFAAMNAYLTRCPAADVYIVSGAKTPCFNKIRDLRYCP